jgi:hypothetical protein
MSGCLPSWGLSCCSRLPYCMHCAAHPLNCMHAQQPRAAISEKAWKIDLLLFTGTRRAVLAATPSPVPIFRSTMVRVVTLLDSKRTVDTSLVYNLRRVAPMHYIALREQRSTGLGRSSLCSVCDSCCNQVYEYQRLYSTEYHHAFQPNVSYSAYASSEYFHVAQSIRDDSFR